MSRSETRLEVVDFTCPGCDCGTCVTETVEEIGELSGVSHVRLDRRLTQIVVRHEAVDGFPVRFREIVLAHGIELRD